MMEIVRSFPSRAAPATTQPAQRRSSPFFHPFVDGDKSIARSAALRAARRGDETRSPSQEERSCFGTREISCLPPTLPAHIRRSTLSAAPNTDAVISRRPYKPLRSSSRVRTLTCVPPMRLRRRTADKMAEFGDAGKTPVASPGLGRIEIREKEDT